MSITINSDIDSEQSNLGAGSVKDAASSAIQTCATLINYFSRHQWYLFWSLIVIGFILRWHGLGERALHHDESLHAMWGKYFLDNPDIRFYHYDPMLHGPLLYNTLFFTYFSLGDSVWSARFPVALMGTFFMFLPLLFRSYFLPITTLILTGFVSISPTLVYWSRFIREDFFTLLPIFLSIIGVTIAKGKWRAYLFFIGVSLQFCSKENSYVHLAILLGYLLFEPLFNFIAFAKFSSSLLKGLSSYVKSYWIEFILGILAAILIYVILYSGWGLYPKGILDGLYRKSIVYWLDQSNQERIQGPFMFHFYVLFYYEIIFLILGIVQLWLVYKEAVLAIKVLGIITLLIATGLWFFYGALYWWVGFSDPSFAANQREFIDLFELWEFLKLKDGFDVFGAVIFSINSVLITVHHLIRKERRLAVCGYFFTATLFTYSYLGEKVPWLTLYPFISGIIYYALYYQDYFIRNPIKFWHSYQVGSLLSITGLILVILGAIFMAEKWFIIGDLGISTIKPEENSFLAWLVFYLSRSNLIFLLIGTIVAIIGTIDNLILNNRVFGRVNLLYTFLIISFIYNFRAMGLTNFVYGGNEREVLSQVHTAKEALDIVELIEYEVLKQPRGYQPHIYVAGDAVWPLTWYFRKLPTYDYTADEEKRKNFLFRIEDWKEGAAPLEGYTQRRFNLRGWWVPDYNTATLKRMLHYSINHEPWTQPGFAYANLYYRVNPEGQPLK